MRRVLGVDVGVIIDRIHDGTDTSFFGTRYLETTPVPNVFDTLALLRSYFERVCIVSKCGDAIERKTRDWLEYHRFCARVGIEVRDLFFCSRREGKVPLCGQLGVTDFEDDRLEMLGYLPFVPHRYLFQPKEEEVELYIASGVIPTARCDWDSRGS